MAFLIFQKNIRSGTARALRKQYGRVSARSEKHEDQTRSRLNAMNEIRPEPGPCTFQICPDNSRFFIVFRIQIVLFFLIMLKKLQSPNSASFSNQEILLFSNFLFKALLLVEYLISFLCVIQIFSKRILLFLYLKKLIYFSLQTMQIYSLLFAVLGKDVKQVEGK